MAASRRRPGGRRSGGGGGGMPLVRLLLVVAVVVVVVASQSTLAGAAWVEDYASNHGCGETAAAALCDPGDPSANRACRDACHYSGCRGGGCVDLASGDGDGGGGARGCHCLP